MSLADWPFSLTHNPVEPEGPVVFSDPAEGYQQPVFLKRIDGKGLYGSLGEGITMQAAAAYIYQLEMGERQLQCRQIIAATVLLRILSGQYPACSRAFISR